VKKRIHFDHPGAMYDRAHSVSHRARIGLLAASAACVSSVPGLALAQSSSSPFMTGANALQINILAWLTPIAIILVMVLGAMAMAARMSWGWCIGAILGIAQVSTTYGAREAQNIVENCANTLILRCSGSENGGTAQFASRLIGDREIIRRQTSRGRDRDNAFMSQGSRRSTLTSEHHVTEPAVLASELEQLPDLTAYLKTASSSEWLRVAFSR
jgi:type IV secretory pathway VirB2 component (pilin)